MGHYIIDPGIRGAKYALSEDMQVRCLAYLLSVLREKDWLPDTAELDVIQVQYIGAPYPALGIRDNIYIYSPEYLTSLSLKVEDKLTDFISEIGIEQLIERSSVESLRWQDVFNVSNVGKVDSASLNPNPTDIPFVAAMSGDIDAFVHSLHDSSPEQRVKIASKCLAVAAGLNRLSVVKQMNDFGADLNFQDKSGSTALMLAAEMGWESIVVYLLAHGARPEIVDSANRTAAYRAELKGHKDIAAMLAS